MRKIWRNIFCVWMLIIIALFGVIALRMYQNNYSSTTFDIGTTQGELNVLIIVFAGIIAFLVCTIILILVVIRSKKGPMVKLLRQ
jgi:hypothetical protein